MRLSNKNHPPRQTSNRPCAAHFPVALVLIVATLGSFGSASTANAQRSILRSTTHPVAIDHNVSAINHYLAGLLRQKRNIGSRNLTSDEIARVNLVRRKIVRRVLDWAEESWQELVVDMGYDKPFGIWVPHGGKQYLHLFLEDKGINPDGGMTFGSVRRDDSKLTLNIRAFFKHVKNPHPTPNRILKGTVPHELFHAIQNSYSIEFSRWAKESTAEWAAEQVFPDQNHFVNRQARFLAHPEFGLHQVNSPAGAIEQHDAAEHDHNQYGHGIGRPYGTSVFWMFMTKHDEGPAGRLMSDLWTNARTTNNAYEALSKSMRDTQKMGPKFCDYFERFAVGAMLHDAAPDEYRLHDVELLKRKTSNGTSKALCQTVNLKELWTKYANQSFAGPESAVMNVDFVAAHIPLATQNGPVFQIHKKYGQLMGAGFRVFRVPAHSMGSDNATLSLQISAPEKEISIQALYKPGGDWKVIRGTFENGSHRISVPGFEKTSTRNVYFIVCRFGEGTDLKSYPMRFSCARAPVVRSVKLTQGGTVLLDSHWAEELDSAGKLIRRSHQQSGFTNPAPGATPVQLTVEFDDEIRAGAELLCKLNGSPVNLLAAESDRVWRANIDPGDLLRKVTEHRIELAAQLKLRSANTRLPLDEDPATVATLDLQSGAWTGYERAAKKMVIRFQPRKEYTATMIPNDMVTQQRNGPVWLNMILGSPDIGGIDQPYVVVATLGNHKQFLYPANVEAYGFASHPLAQLSSFRLPENLDSPLPDEISALFVTQDGQTIEKTFSIEYQKSPKPTFGSPDASELNTEIPKWKADYRKALQSHQSADSRFGGVIRNGESLMLYDNDYRQARKIWTEIQDLYLAAVRENSGSQDWLLRRFANVERVYMGVAYKNADVDELLRALKARTAGGRATIVDYIGVMDACIRFQNDVETVHRLWNEMQELPEANRRKPATPGPVENWKFMHDSMVDYSKPLRLPKARIQTPEVK